MKSKIDVSKHGVLAFVSKSGETDVLYTYDLNRDRMLKSFKWDKLVSFSSPAWSAGGTKLAFAGINRSIPMMHGSQGCTAFGKVLFVRHFREPIPLQTTAMDQVSTVLGADESIIEGLKTIAEKSKPDLIVHLI